MKFSLDLSFGNIQFFGYIFLFWCFLYYPYKFWILFDISQKNVLIKAPFSFANTFSFHICSFHMQTTFNKMKINIYFFQRSSNSFKVILTATACRKFYRWESTLGNCLHDANYLEALSYIELRYYIICMTCVIHTICILSKISKWKLYKMRIRSDPSSFSNRWKMAVIILILLTLPKKFHLK